MTPTPRDLSHNVRIYIASTLLLNLTAAFGDANVLLPALALRLNAPSWLVTLPLVGQMAVAYIPVLLMGWLMRPGWSRKALYAGSCAAMFVVLLLLAIPLLGGAGRSTLLGCMAVSWTLFALAQGIGVLPWWDLFARLFPPEHRGRMLGLANAVGQVVTLAAAGTAAWIISDHSPLAYPASYGVALSVYVAGGLAYSLFIMQLREPPPAPDPSPAPPDAEGCSLGDYARGLIDTVRREPAFARTLLAATFGGAIVAVSPLFLAFAQKHQGFTPAATNALVFLRPLAVIPAALLAGHISRRIPPQRVVAGIAATVAGGALAAPWLTGPWQFVPLLLTGLAPLSYHFCLVSVMSHAPAGQAHRYLAIYYVAALLPGFSPMALGALLDRSPTAAIGLVAALAATATGLFWRAGRSPDGRANPRTPA